MTFSTTTNSSINYDQLVERINFLEKEVFKLKENGQFTDRKERYLDPKDASTYLGVSLRTFYRIMSRSEVGFTIVGRNRKVLQSDLENYIKKNSICALGSLL